MSSSHEMDPMQIDELLTQAFGIPKYMEEVEPEESKEMACTKCNSKEDIILDYSEAEYVCQKCGTVIMQWMDDSPDWRNDMEEGIQGDKSRVGAPTSRLLSSCNFSTIIPRRGKMRRAAVIHEHMSMSYTDRALYKVFKEIARVCSDVLNLGQSIIDTAKEMYKDIKDQKITRGENHKALIACCVYYACKLDRCMGAQRKKDEVCLAFNLDKSSFTHSSKIFLDLIKDRSYFEKCLEDNNVMRGIITRTLGPLPIDCSQTRWKVVREVEDMYELIRMHGDGATDSKTPHAIITALVFLTTRNMGMKITKNDIKTHCDVSTVTLNKTIALVSPILESIKK